MLSHSFEQLQILLNSSQAAIFRLQILICTSIQRGKKYPPGGVKFSMQKAILVYATKLVVRVYTCVL